MTKEERRELRLHVDEGLKTLRDLIKLVYEMEVFLEGLARKHDDEEAAELREAMKEKELREKIGDVEDVLRWLRIETGWL
jgi:hypothetical protein